MKLPPKFHDFPLLPPFLICRQFPLFSSLRSNLPFPADFLLFFPPSRNAVFPRFFFAFPLRQMEQSLQSFPRKFAYLHFLHSRGKSRCNSRFLIGYSLSRRFGFFAPNRRLAFEKFLTMRHFEGVSLLL